jgi:signal transduction histidine kinase|tara:strand:- start:562 stop:2304 length:1743 start_codon:yes stop_codon:yes gene_type:complete
LKKIQKSILLKQIKIVNESLKHTILTTVILGGVLALQVYKELSVTFLTVWSALLIVSIIIRTFLLVVVKKDPPNGNNIQKWVNLNFLNTGLSAIIYGIVAGSTYFMTDQVAITIVYIIIAGVTAGAASTYGALRYLSTVFIFPVIIPLTLANLVVGDLNHIILALITVLFCYVIYSTSTNLYKTFLNTLEQNIVIEDLTEEKVRMEEMAKLKSDFFASMSHEIRTPLNGVVGLVELLIETKIDRTQKDYLTIIRKSSDDLLNIINDVLDLSKIESDKLELLPKKTNLPDFLKRMIVLFSQRAKDKNINLKLTLDDNLPNYIFFDEHRLSQITTNLISNAIKFTNKGSVHLSVEVLIQSNSSVKLKFKVEDTGIGIPVEKQSIIFNKYDQIANSTNYLITQVGTGLGLSIANKLVNLMHGDIGVYSEPKQGSTFWFTIEVPKFKSIPPINIRGRNHSTKFNLNVLLVDDRDVNLKVARLMLQKFGCKVTLATNGEEAISIYKEKPRFFDLIIMDIQMPVMDGITATKKLREIYPDDLAPVYGLSAQIAKNLHKSPEELGFDLYLNKPLTLDSLNVALKQLE